VTIQAAIEVAIAAAAVIYQSRLTVGQFIHLYITQEIFDTSLLIG